MRIAVTGGTGFVGSALVRSLRARGDEVIVFSRSSGSGSVAWTPGASGPWTESLRGVDAVVNLAGAGLFDERWTPARIAIVRESRIATTRVLAEAMARECPRAVLVSASAVGYYGMRKDDAIVDEDTPAGNDLLSEICLEWEAATAAAAAAGVRVTHARIGIVLGDGGGALKEMLPAFRAFVGGPIGDGRQWLSFIHLNDVVSSLTFLADRPDATGAYNITAPNPVTMNEFAKALGRALGRPSLFRVPPFALKIVMGEGRADALLTGPRVMPKRLLAAGFTFAFPRVDAALADVLRTH